ncbi:unnamed protein product [Rotaria sordida]|uniref:ADP ribosyltransferase domain-containing protein n=1 Tax=Rotaria sordida TaxID=392033 RepID=A0A816CBD0_9BILA|nr:unnamed protein product [Rotaria sordida]CAF1620088.1 unnamed protein product [Rotaria sordida]
MPTPTLPIDDLHTKIDDPDIETFCLIWLDANVNTEENRDTKQKLNSIIKRLETFQDIEQCQKYIEEQSQKDRLIMIVSGRLGQEIVPSIHQLKQIILIYVYCGDKDSNKPWAEKFSKVKAVVDDSNELISRIKADHKTQKMVEESVTINFFDKSMTGLNGKFVFSQVLMDCLLQLKYTSEDKKELIDRCEQEYRGDSMQLNYLREFEKYYSSDKVLMWYTRQSFFFKTLNKALRTEDYHLMFLLRAYISDMYNQLKNCQAKNPLQVYRGQKISSDELQNLKRRLNQFISVNSFFSTSKDKNVALPFLNVDDAAHKLVPVLYEIDADPNIVAAKPFADISAFSEFPSESEILFMPGSIFRLNSVNCSKDDSYWIIHMTLCSDDEHDLKEVLMYMKQQLVSGETNLRTLGKILWEMGKFDLAKQYFTRLLKELSPNDPLLGTLYDDLGKLASQIGDFNTSIQWYKQSAAFKSQNQLTSTSSIKEASNPIDTLTTTAVGIVEAKKETDSNQLKNDTTATTAVTSATIPKVRQ